MNNLNIISKLNFENTNVGTLSSFKDNNKYSSIIWNGMASPKIIEENNKKVLKIDTPSARIESPILYSGNEFMRSNFQVEINLEFITMSPSNAYFGFSNNRSRWMSFFVRSSLEKGLIITLSGSEISCNYIFETNKKYNIIVTRQNDTYTFMINGEIIGYTISEEFSSKITSVNTIIVLGSADNSTNTDNASNLKIYGVNISVGENLKYYSQYTSHGNSLKSKLYFANKITNTSASSYTCNIEAIKDSKYIWEYNPSFTYNGEYIKNNTSFKTNVSNNFTCILNLRNNINHNNIELINVSNNYKVMYTYIKYSEPEPEVIVNDKTTSAIDFENGLNDKITSTVWTLSNTAKIQSNNSIFGDFSLEASSATDSMITTSKLITGNNTPYTIDMYMLIKGRQGFGLTYPLFSQVKNTSFGEQEINMSENNILTYYRNNSVTPILPRSIMSNTKIRINEINKITLSYDGSALRLFINNILEDVIGTSVGWVNTDTEPFRVFESLVPAYNTYRNSTQGLVDNINIFDNISMKNKTYNENDAFLMCHLDFIGENNTKNIVDTAPINKSVWNTVGNVLLSTTANDLNRFSTLKLDGNASYIQTNDNLAFNFISDFTIEINFITSTNTRRQILIDKYNGNNGQWQISVNNDGTLYFTYNDPYKFFVSKRNDLNNGKPHKVRIVKEKTLLYIYIDESFDSVNSVKDIDFFQTGNYTVAVGAQVNSRNAIYDFIGNIGEIRVYNGKAIHPKQMIDRMLDIKVNNARIDSNIGWNTSQAVIENDNFKNSIIDYSGSNVFTFYGSDFNLKCKFKGYGNIIKEWGSNLRFNFNITSAGACNINFYEAGTNQRTVTTNAIALLEVNEIEIIRKSGYYFIYVNGVSYTVTQSANPFTGEIYGPTKEGVICGDSTINIISLSIDKIKYYNRENIDLDFNNNLNDEFKNSTWQNSGAVFDPRNSYKGYSLGFTANNKVYTGTNTALNFEDKDFNIEFNALPNTIDSSARIVISNGETSITPNLRTITYQTNGRLYSYLGDSNVNGLFSLQSIVSSVGSTYLKHNIFRKKNAFFMKVNNVLTAVGNAPNNYIYNMNSNNVTNIGTADYTNTAFYKGYIDDVFFQKGSSENIEVDQPALHIPFESSVSNIGIAELDITTYITPIYTIIDSKKCVDLTSSYFRISANTSLRITDNTDFYFEVDVYPTEDKYHILMCSGATNSTTDLCSIALSSSNEQNIAYIYISPSLSFKSSNNYNLNQWNKIIVKRNNNTISIILNDVETKHFYQGSLDFSKNNTFIARDNYDGGKSKFVGYMTDLSLFIGTDKKSENYDKYKVMDLDFSPAYESFIFNDKFNKVVLQPVNFNQRDYYNGRYCVYFDGSSNKQIHTTKNNLLNFEFDDFIIRIDFLMTANDIALDKWKLLLGTGSQVSSTDYCYLGVSPITTSGRPSSLTFTVVNNNQVITIQSQEDITLNSWESVYFGRINGVYKLIYKGIEAPIQNNTGGDKQRCNFNGSDNTVIGRSGLSVDHQFKGYISKVLIYRNTSDLSLLEGENIIGIDEKYTLSNGVETETITLKDTSNRNVKLINDDDKVSLSVNNILVEVPKNENEINGIEIAKNYKGDIKSISLYDEVFYDNDVFLGTELVDTEFGEIEIPDNDDYDYELFVSDDYIRGFIEGYKNRNFEIIYDNLNLFRGIEDYIVYNIDERYLDEYMIHDLVSGEKYKVLTHEMIKGFISGTVNLKNCGVTSNNMEVFCYRSDNYRHIGTYSVDKDGKYIIPNLDVNSRYDIIFRDKTRKIKDQISNYRQPMKY